LDFGHSPLTPLPKIQNKKTKLKFFFRAIPIALGIKVKLAHHITRHIWLRLLYKSLHPYLPPLRYGKHQICRNVVRHIFQYFFSNRNFVEEFKKGMEFLFFYFNEGYIRYFLLRSSQKMNFKFKGGKIRRNYYIINKNF